MADASDNAGVLNTAALPGAAPAAIDTGSQASASGTVTTTAITALPARETATEESLPEEPAGDPRLDRLPMQVDVVIRVHSFRVQDLLSMEKGTVVETIHEHTQDVPVRCGGALLLWSEFEVLDQRLAVRVTRLA
jgi:flagellar motor switch protein FliN/FliY